MTPEEVTRLFEATRTTLEKSIFRLRDETRVNFPSKATSFRDGIAVHDGFKQPCPVCGTLVQRIVCAEYETTYCPRCQTDGRILANRALPRLLKEDWARTVEEWESAR